MKNVILWAILLTCTAPQNILAGVFPLAISFIPPLQNPSQKFTIAGVRLSTLVGSHDSVYGLDLGIIGNFSDNFGGIALAGGFNKTKEATIVLAQLAGVANINDDVSGFGLQAALGFNSNKKGTFTGIQAGLLGNFGKSNIAGIQVGLINQANRVYGIQFGLYNKAKSLHGVQIGLININDNGPLKLMSGINIGF